MKSVSEILRELGVDINIENDVKLIIDELSIIAKGTPLDARLVASIYIALNEKSIPRSVYSIIQALNIESKKKRQALRKAAWTIISKYMRAKMVKSFSLNLDLDTIKNNLISQGLSEEIVLKSLNLFFEAREKLKKFNPQISTLLASCIYTLSIISGDDQSAKRALKIFKVSKTAVRKWSKKLLEILSERKKEEKKIIS